MVPKVVVPMDFGIERNLHCQFHGNVTVKLQGGDYHSSVCDSGIDNPGLETMAPKVLFLWISELRTYTANFMAILL